MLAEPAGSRWVMNETGEQLGYDPVTGEPARTDTLVDGTVFSDGGPTSWQAAILTPSAAPGSSTVKSEALQPYREFYMEYSDFQHAYEAGVYVGTGQDGIHLEGTGAGLPPVAHNAGNPQFDGTTANSFRFAINPPARLQANPVFPDLVLEVTNTQNDPLNNFCPERPCPQAISVSDPGVLVANYRMEPVALRVYDPNKLGPDGKPGMQADGKPGDLAFALQSRTDRVMPELNVMPDGNTVINGTRFPPHINAAGYGPGDPFTPMMRTYAGDTIRVKMQSGGHEEEHNASIHGLKWLQGGSGHGKAPNSGWRNSQAGGISEQFTLTTPMLPVDKNRGPLADYVYSMDSDTSGWWSGTWGILRAYEDLRADLFKLPGANSGPVTLSNTRNFNGVCPKGAPIRAYSITAILAQDLLDPVLNVTVAPTGPVGTMHAGAPLNPQGGTLVYNSRDTSVAGNFVIDGTGETVSLVHQGPLHDPTAIVYVNTDDIVTTGKAQGRGKLKPGAPLEPVVIRAAAGECLQILLSNKLPAIMPDLANYTTLLGVAKRDRFSAEGSTTFNMNLVRPSSYAGLHPQLVAVDVTQDDGRIVGANPERRQLAAPAGGGTFYQWYVGDLGGTPVNGKVDLVATPIEFGGSNLFPVDVIKQGAKSMVGTLVVHPEGSTWVEDTQVFDHQNGVGTRATHAQATVTAGGKTFRDFSLVLTKGNTHYYRDGSPVEHLNGEGVGIPEDSQEATGMSLNYGIEPLWFRMGILPQAPFGNAGCVGGCYGAMANVDSAFSNELSGGQDPATPVFQANRNQQTRIHITNPNGTSRGSTFALHGHSWQRDPYICPTEARNGLTGACEMNTVGSRAIGVNPQGFETGGQESWTPYSHFDIVLPSAGGGNGIAGDYLMRDQASFGAASGVWGIMRVK
ncbi:MAG: hypothetical protein JJE42_03360 [Burkholderiales bacterium]|nr:hypothetical protein [Burkholderiales bacterium]